MRGGVNAQVTHLFNASGIFQPGVSKHEAKEEARAEGATTWAELGARLAVYSYNTAEEYKDVWHEFASYSRSELGLKDLEKTSAEHIRNYLEWKSETVASSTFDKICSALGKLENALNMYSDRFDRENTYDLRTVIFETKDSLHDELRQGDGRHAYNDPLAIRDAINEGKHQVAAAIQHEGGARIGGVDKIEAHQLHGIDEKGRGVIFQEGYNTKGGRVGTIYVNRDTYDRLSFIVEREGSFSIDRDAYRADIRQACEQVGEKYSGSHAFRHNFAQEAMGKLQSGGASYMEALSVTSDLMFHSRADIVERYLP